MVMNSRAGTIFRRQDGASQQKRGTIFGGNDNEASTPTVDTIQENEKYQEVHGDDTLNIPMDEVNKFENKDNKQALKNYDGSVNPTPVTIVREVASTEQQIEDAKKRMDNLIEGSDVMLCMVQSIFPFDLFPDKVIIDVNKINIISKEFFKSERVHSVMIEDISDVFIETSPFFAKLSIVDKNFAETSVGVSFLKKEDAARARRIIQGLVIAKQQTMDVTHISPTELVPRLEQLGKAQ